MNILKDIEEQIQLIKKLDSNIALEAVQTHIERAELLYEMGKQQKDEQYFTDVIYRTNQAFEGSLRQAYMILDNQPENRVSRKRTVDIEEYLATNSIFQDRVLYHFKNYRQEWRNKSTHDFKLFFSESEALLAIVNVSAYTYVLFNQILERVAYNVEKNRLINQKNNLKEINEIAKQKEKGLKLKIIELIGEFSKNENHLDQSIKEIELIGTFAAFVESASNDFTVLTEKAYLHNDTKWRIDIIVISGEDKVIIEVKRSGVKYSRSFDWQLFTYMERTNISSSILWLPKYIVKSKDLDIIDRTIVFGNKRHKMTIVN